MAILDTVRPGDVISSDLLNRIIGLLNEHDALLAGGNGGGSQTGLLLTGFSPAQQQNIGKNLTLFGNFDFPLATNAVSIDGVPISPAALLAGSNNIQLVFTIPTNLSVPSGQTKSVLVRIVNSKGTDQKPYVLLPQVAGAPNPSISDARDVVSGNAILRSSREARITGLNFATPAANNQVSLVLNPGPAQVSFPLVVKAGSQIQTAPLPSTLLVDMPALTNTHGIAIGDSAPATLSVTVPNANVAATLGISLERTS